LKICSFVSTECTNVTDRQTPHDGQGRACIASRGKNAVINGFVLTLDCFPTAEPYSLVGMLWNHTWRDAISLTSVYCRLGLTCVTECARPIETYIYTHVATCQYPVCISERYRDLYSIMCLTL